jgi:glutamyl-tRNA synthetase
MWVLVATCAAALRSNEGTSNEHDNEVNRFPALATAGCGMNSVVGRLAPSPTGPLHLGHARSFLVAYWHARKHNGRLFLRQEDLDVGRSRQEFSDLVRFDLEWLGLDWDEPEWIQSQHAEGIRAAAKRLMDQGDAYACVCSRGEIQAVSAPHVEDTPPVYNGRCRGRFSSVEQAEASTGRQAGIRARVPPGTWQFHDGIFGAIEQDLTSEVGDFLIMRRDKIPAYQLAVVVDDARQGVNTVIRGCDLLDSTPRQLFLHQALGLTPPRYLHLPLVMSRDGERLAKRAKGLSLQELRTRGVDPREIVTWVARSCGLAFKDWVTPREVTNAFDISAIARVPVTVPDYW